MPKATRDVPPPLELACLKALWSLEEGNVKDVQRMVAQSRPLAYTTIMTVLERLVRKGKIVRRKVGRAFVYSPAESRDALRRVAIRELLEAFFDGSEDELIRFLRQPEVRETAKAASAAPAEDERIDTVLL
jgi:predicted transcriptional regulator